MSKKNAIMLAIIVLLALSLRMFCVIKSVGAPLGGDELCYDSIARNLVEGRGYGSGYVSNPSLTATRGPSYVFFVAVIYSAFGANPEYVRVAQAVLDCLCCLLLAKICMSIFGRMDTALLAAFIYAVYPPFIMNTRYILTETLTLLLITLAISLFLDSELTTRRMPTYAAAVVTGIAALSKPIMLFLPLLVFMAGIGGKECVVSRAKSLALSLFLVALVMSPWITRNAIVFHSFIPGVSQGGFTFWGGTGPADGRVVGGLNEPWTPKHIEPSIMGLSEVERDRWFYSEGMRVIRGNPARYLRVIIRKVPRLWFNLMKDEPSLIATKTLDSIGLGSQWTSRVNAVFALVNVIAIGLAVIGITRTNYPPVSRNLLLWLILYFTAIHMVFFAVFRYSMPVYAYLFCFTAAGITVLFRKHSLDIV